MRNNIDVNIQNIEIKLTDYEIDPLIMNLLQGKSLCKPSSRKEREMIELYVVCHRVTMDRYRRHRYGQTDWQSYKAENLLSELEYIRLKYDER